MYTPKPTTNKYHKILIKAYPYLSIFLGIGFITGFSLLCYDFSKIGNQPIDIITQDIQASSIKNEIDSDNPSRVIINLSGEVLYPDEYDLSPGSIVMEAINLAGGFTPEADLSNLPVNLASVLDAEQTIIIPDKYSNANSTEIKNQSSKININSANQEELMKLNGVGEKTAQKIIEYRKTNPFKSIEDILEVSGIGEKTFAKFKDQITI